MNWRMTLIVSLGANLALGAVALRHWLRPPPSPPAVEDSLPVVVPPRPASESLPDPVPDPAQPTPFHWREIESDDYRQYVANLRRVNCPPHVLRDVVLADLDQLYARTHDRSVVRYEPWTGADRRREVTETQRRRERQRTLEHRALVRELLGADWSHNAVKTWHEEAILQVLAGFLTDEKAMLMAAVVERTERDVRNVREDADGILLDSDRARLSALHDGFTGELSALLTATEVEELLLRIQGLAVLMNGNVHIDAIQSTAAELRAIAAASRHLMDPLLEELFDLGRRTPPGEEARRKEAFETEVRRILGESRFANYQRAQEEGFRQAAAFARNHDLPLSAAIETYDTRKRAEEERRQVLADDELDVGQKQAALELIRQLAEHSAQTTLGGPAAEEYLRENEEWLKGLVTVPPPVSAGEEGE